jgi:hypothetical protein
MTIRVRLLLPFVLGTGLLVQGCAPSPQAVKPVVYQNQQNIAALSENIKVLMSMYEPLLNASIKSLMYQHITKTHRDLVGVTGGSFGPAVDDWDKIFAGPRHKAFAERYKYVKAALGRGITGQDLEKLRFKEGWVYTAAANGTVFTPEEANELAKALTKLQKSAENPEEYFRAAETRLLPYDRKLVMYRKIADGSLELFRAFKQEINNELNMAAVHSQAMADYANSQIDPQKVVGSIEPGKVNQVLTSVGEKYISDPDTRTAAVDFITKGIGAFMQ